MCMLAVCSITERCCAMLQLNRCLGKPKPGDVNPFVIFMKSKTVERGDAPFAVTFSLLCADV